MVQWGKTSGVASLTIAALFFAAPAFADPSDGAAPGVPNKSTIVVPDVKPPTQPAPLERPAPRPAGEGAQQDVVAVVRGADGNTRVTLYEAAPGISDQRLYQMLRSSGVQGLQDPARRTVGPRTPTTCTWGSATTFECPQVHWSRNGYSHPQIYFVDHSGDAWPVTAAVPVWNEAQGVDSWYRWAHCPAVNGAHCVGVFSGNYGDTGWVGFTSALIDNNRTFIDTSVGVQLNDFYSITAARRRKSTCHELGHALGMGHNWATNSCLISGAYEPQRPNGDDFALIADIYRSF
jgi:hypothetical protein